MRRNIALVLVGLAALLSTASLLGVLRHALAREKAEPEVDPLEAERKRVRAAMGDALADLNVDHYPENLRPRPGLPDRDTVRGLMPVLDPPLSRTISEERDESR